MTSDQLLGAQFVYSRRSAAGSARTKVINMRKGLFDLACAMSVLL